MEGTTQTKKTTPKKVIAIILDVLLYTFLALAVVVVALTVMSKVAQKDDANGAPNLFGYEMRYVETGSMEPEYPVNTMIFIERAPENQDSYDKWVEKNIKVGDVVTFCYREANQRVVITHRVIAIEPCDEVYAPGSPLAGLDKGGYKITFQGDNKGADGEAATETIYTYAHDNPMAEAKDQTQGWIIGKVVGQNYILGLAVTTLKQPLGMVLIIIVPCLIVIIIEVVRIVKVFGAEKNAKFKKKEKEQEDKLAQQNSEIELLKQQLALLQQQQVQMQQQQTIQSEDKPE